MSIIEKADWTRVTNKQTLRSIYWFGIKQRPEITISTVLLKFVFEFVLLADNRYIACSYIVFTFFKSKVDIITKNHIKVSTDLQIARLSIAPVILF